MRNKFLLIALTGIIILSFCGCFKNSPAPFTSYLKGKINGVAFECNAHIKANPSIPLLPDAYLEISGDFPIGSIQMTINNGVGPVITTGQYIFGASKTRRGTIWADGGTVYSAGDDPSLGVVNGSGKITILEISSDYVKGNFEFTTKPDDITHNVKTITNGEFHIKRSF